MRALQIGESVRVEGERLIAGNTGAGAAVVSHLDRPRVFGRPGDAVYGFVLGDTLVRQIEPDGMEYHLRPNMYFALNGPVDIDGTGGVVIVREGFRCLNAVGGPTEASGRLRYIDGCTDSLLIGPPRVGDPCLNLLHFPRNIRQTMHTHPSLRCGITVAGRGRAIFPDGEVPLVPGSCWFLETGGQHCFYTDDSELTVIAWHPDTDAGPSDDDHPMLNKTMVDGVSAKHLDAIRTQPAQVDRWPFLPGS